MDNPVKQLVPLIAFCVKEKGSTLSKTKLLKLLYLFDVEFFRVYRRTFSGFPWKFYHLGPWVNEFSQILDEVETEGHLNSKSWQNLDYEGKTYLPPRDFDEDQAFRNLFTAYKEESIFKRVLEQWSEKSTGEILDYVYFKTEPMENADRGHLLNFDSIKAAFTPKYSRTASEISPKHIKKLRMQFEEKYKSKIPIHFDFTPPRYDHVFNEAMAKLEESSA